MNVGSLFSGIGGIDLGLERAGMRVVFQCESDEWRRRVLAERFPGCPCVHAVQDIDAGRVHRLGVRGAGCSGRAAPADGEQGAAVDLLCGGFPCQDLSVAGRRAGLNGQRSSLFFEFARVADDLVQPGGLVLVENVPGLLSSNGGRDFAVVLATLADLGFHDLAWRVLDSRHFGVPQRRRRVFVVGRRTRGHCCAEILLEPESGGGHPAAGGAAAEDVANPLGSSARGGRSGGGMRYDLDNDSYVAYTHSGGATYREADSFGSLTQQSASETSAMTPLISFDAEHSNQGSPSGDAVLTRKLRRRAVIDGHMVRRLTPRECERLQGFPDDWTNLGPDSRRYAALGDAVTVPVAEWIGRRIMAVVA